MDEIQIRNRNDQIKARFIRFHRAHPEVWDMYEDFTFRLIRAGREYYSSDAIVHRIRWETDVTTRGEEPFKISDHYTAYYARMFEAKYPHYAGFFRKHRLRSKDRPAYNVDTQGPSDDYITADDEPELMAELKSLVEETSQNNAA